jgi:hypothetical protein
MGPWGEARDLIQLACIVLNVRIAGGSVGGNGIPFSRLGCCIWRALCLVGLRVAKEGSVLRLLGGSVTWYG